MLHATVIFFYIEYCVFARQAGTWDPLLPCYNAYTWTKVSLSNKTQRNYEGIKITTRMRSWGKFWTTRHKETKKPSCHFWRAESKSRGSGEKAGYCACRLHTTPQKGWARHLRHPSGPTPGHTPTLTPYTEPARPPSGSELTRETVICSRSPSCSRGRTKDLPVSCLASDQFLLIKEAKNPGQYHLL